MQTNPLLLIPDVDDYGDADKDNYQDLPSEGSWIVSHSGVVKSNSLQGTALDITTPLCDTIQLSQWAVRNLYCFSKFQAQASAL